MNGVWATVLLIMGVAALGLVKAALGDMVQEEMRTRLSRIPYAMIRLAALRVPADLRDDLAAEWNAELDFVLTGTAGMPLTRLARGIRFSAGLLTSAREITKELSGEGASLAARLIRVVIGIVVGIVGIGGIVTAITTTAPSLGITATIGQTCMALSFVIGALTLITWRYTPFRVTSGLLLACAANIAFYLHGGDRMNLVWAASYVFFLLLATAYWQKLRRDERRWREDPEVRILHAVLYPDCTDCLGPRPAELEHAPELVATIVNRLVHHGLVADPDVAAEHIQNLVNEAPGRPSESRRWLQEQIDRITDELGT